MGHLTDDDSHAENVIRDIEDLPAIEQLGVLIGVIFQVARRSKNDLKVIDNIAEYMPRQYREIRLLDSVPVTGTRN